MLVAINKKVRGNKGFTLVELLLVVAILAVLAFLAIPRIADTIKQGRERTCTSNVHIIEEAVNRFHADMVASGEQDEAELWPCITAVVAADGETATGSPVTANAAGAAPLWHTNTQDEMRAYFNKVPSCPFSDANNYEIFYTWKDSRVVGFRVVCTGNAAGTGH